MKFQFIEVTKEIADQMLARNTKNRPLSEPTVHKYMMDLELGKWQESPEPISFFENGSLRDGQHRLTAISKTGIPVKCLVVYDVPNDSTIVDMNRPRSIRDIMTLAGEEQVFRDNRVIGMVRFLLAHYSRALNHASASAVQSFMNEYRAELRVAFELAGGANSNISKRSVVMAAVLVAVASGVDERTLKSWCEAVNTGFTVDLTESAAIVLRNYVMDKGVTNGIGEKERMFDIALLSIKDYVNGVSRFRVYNIGKTKNIPYWSEFAEKYLDPLFGEVTK